MANMKLQSPRIAAIGTCVPPTCFDTVKDVINFTQEEVQKFVEMVGVKQRYLANDSICCSDLCVAAAEKILAKLNWEKESIDALIMITHTPDYILPATACLIQGRLGLSDKCACFDVGLGCSGYCYGLWLATMMLQEGRFRRILLLVGETPSRLCYKSDRSVALLFGDAGSATAIEWGNLTDRTNWYFALHSDGYRYADFVVEAGGLRNRHSDEQEKYYINMNGANIFQFSIKRVPPLIQETMALSGTTDKNIDYYIFHQANKFIINHLIKKMNVPMEKAPVTIGEFGNVGGSSIPLTITNGKLDRNSDRALKLMLLGYGVGLSWGSALIDLDAGTLLEHMQLAV